LGAAHLSAREVSREQKNGDDQAITIRDKKEALEQDVIVQTSPLRVWLSEESEALGERTKPLSHPGPKEASQAHAGF
jgi:hypothetical protein